MNLIEKAANRVDEWDATLTQAFHDPLFPTAGAVTCGILAAILIASPVLCRAIGTAYALWCQSSIAAYIGGLAMLLGAA